MNLAFLRPLLAPAPPSVASASDLRAFLASAPSGDGVERAALGGYASSTLGWAFAAGYEAALARAAPSLGKGTERELAALCATEEAGGHPRAIQTTLVRAADGWRLSGRKTWVTLGLDADLLLVVASTGQEGGRNRLRVAVVPSRRSGVVLASGAPLPFAPEIGHAVVDLREVAVSDDEILPGDGYDDLLKPFRTIEDVHVMAGVLGWSLAVAARSGWQAAWRSEALAALTGLRALGAASPSQPETHVALAGALAATRRLLDQAEWAATDEKTRAGWERDRPLLDVANRVRLARFDAAWRSLQPAAEAAQHQSP